ncbi:MAG TPA: hypothetical protein PLH11_04265 [Gemmobacter sp.]|nr:hypothetical protein [Gemmobacter sp.]
MAISTLYIFGFVAMYLSGLLTFHLMPVLQQTAQPNLYAIFLFPLIGTLTLLVLLWGYALLRGLPLLGEASPFALRQVPTVFALVVTVSLGQAGFGLSTWLVALVMMSGFALTFFVTDQIFK